jgi:hypothetical protein
MEKTRKEEEREDKALLERETRMMTKVKTIL